MDSFSKKIEQPQIVGLEYFVQKQLQKIGLDLFHSEQSAFVFGYLDVWILQRINNSTIRHQITKY